MDPHHHQIDAPIVIEEQAWVCAEAFVIQRGHGRSGRLYVLLVQW